MRKILTVAAREYRAMVGTKAFIFGLAMMPVMMFGGILAIDLVRKTDTVEDRKIAVIDHTQQLFGALQTAAEAHNALMNQAKADDGLNDPLSRGDRYQLEEVPVAGFDDSQRLQLSDQIRAGDLYAFVEIPAGVLSGGAAAASEQDREEGAGDRNETAQDSSDDRSSPADKIAFVSTDATLAVARRWVSNVVNERISAIRLQKAGIDPSTVRQATQHVEVRGLGLFERDSAGKAVAKKEKDEMTAIFLPMIAMMLMFMVIFMASQPMLESALEEKSSRVVEVLLGSVNPTQLMWGKLLGTIAGSLTVFAVYFGGVLFVARSKNLLEMIPMDVIPWFIIFQVLGVMFFASIFLAVGSAVSQLKEAQSLLLPVWLLLMIPMFVWLQIVREPNGPLSVALTFVPPATPSVIVLRMSTGALIPMWQLLTALLVLVLATALCVFVAGRIFRVGILWQGNTPKLRDLLRWGLAGT